MANQRNKNKKAAIEKKKRQKKEKNDNRNRHAARKTSNSGRNNTMDAKEDSMRQTLNKDMDTTDRQGQRLMSPKSEDEVEAEMNREQ